LGFANYGAPRRAEEKRPTCDPCYRSDDSDRTRDEQVYGQLGIGKKF